MLSNPFVTSAWMFLVPLIAVLLPIWIAQRYGLHFKRKNPNLDDGPISSTVAASLGLLAFMLAFTFQIVGNRFDKRKELLINELSEIRTTFMYAGLIPEPMRSEARKLIVEYVDIRVELARDASKFKQTKLRSEQILNEIWKKSEGLAAIDRSSEAFSLFTASSSSILSLFNERFTVIFYASLPRAILIVLSIVAFLSMLMLGFQFGIAGKVHPLLTLMLGITFAAVMWLIFALDHPETRLIKVNQAPLFVLQEQLHSYN